jgi:hypothetical protein
MPNWSIINSRLTVFVAPDTVVPSALWQAVVGEEPETSAVQRVSATRIETGPFAEGKLTLQIQPSRVDWVHEPIGMGEPGQLPALGVFPVAAQPLLQLGRGWIQSEWFPAIQRIALGFVLISPTPDRKSGYQELRQFIDGVPDTLDATDFQYQVNRPRPSAAHVDDLQVNRLSRWSVGGYTFIAIGPGSQPSESALHHYLRLELDINTSADFQGIIPRNAAEIVMGDLFSGAKEICEHGNRLQ